MLLLFLLMIFLGTEGEQVEFLCWWRTATDGEGAIGVGVAAVTFGLCLAPVQLAAAAAAEAVGPALEDLVGSSPLLLFPVSISHTINHTGGWCRRR